MVLCTTPSRAAFGLKRPCWMPPHHRIEAANNQPGAVGGDLLQESQVFTNINSKLRRNVTIAWNYQVSLVEDYQQTLSSGSALRARESTKDLRAPSENRSQYQADDRNEDGSSSDGKARASAGLAAPSIAVQVPPDATPSMRRSNRDTLGKRKSNLARTRVKYDMELVPPIQRNDEFLEFFVHRRWWIPPPPSAALTAAKSVEDFDTKMPPRRSTRLQQTALEQQLALHHQHLPEECPSPFMEGSSVVWVPSKRSEWEDCISEMTAVCATAEWRRREYMVANNDLAPNAPAPAPLSRDYIKDRVDIDDPLRGYQIRHSTGGWLQGFLMWTNFTTWTRNFKWDSLHPQSGIPSSSRQLVDRDGSLAMRLEALPRTGDPLTSGIIFEHVAEIGLVGSLGGGCGEYLLRMALDDIRRAGQYKFVVLQATDSSRGFYEKFGFVRVGAICLYDTHLPGVAGPKDPPDAAAITSATASARNDLTGSSSPLFEEKKNEEQTQTSPQIFPPLMGYRHWTHANESHASLQMHGGPSYMMCLPLPPEEHEARAIDESHDAEQDAIVVGAAISRNEATPVKSLLETIAEMASVPSKPTIEAASDMRTVSMLQRRASALSVASEVPRAPEEPPLPPALGTAVKKRPEETTLKRNASTLSSSSVKEPTTKRRKNSDAAATSVIAPAERPQVNIPVQDAVPTEERPSTGRGRGRPSGSSNKKQSSFRKRKMTSHEDGEERTYYSVRGPDGRFMRVPIGEEPPAVIMATAKKKDTEGFALKSTNSEGEKSKSAPKARRESPRAAVKPALSQLAAAVVTAPKSTARKNKSGGSCVGAGGKFKKINAAELRKQKVKAYPRTRPHFYNRVVKPIDGRREYYFVFEYNEHTEEMRLVPMEARGTLMGQRQGRPRYQCCIGATDENFISDISHNYQTVDAHMVMKTPFVAQEAWDIEDDE